MQGISWKRTFVVCLISTISWVGVEARPTYGSMVVTSIDRVHDGDTFTVSVDGIPPIIGKEISVRIARIDTPEITSKVSRVKALACKAREYTRERLSQGRVIELINMQRDKYFRILAEVYIDGENLADELMQAGLAKPYDGGTKPVW